MTAFLMDKPATPSDSEMLRREAVLLSFCESPPETCSRLQQLSRNEWRRLLIWLDTSGLALYFLDRMAELNRLAMMPPAVLARLQRNLADNTVRTESMISESTAIQQEFQREELNYLTLKGFSLHPSSVPRLQLRSQLDLDFLINEKSAATARRILEQRGYHLRAVSGRSWEFRTNELPARSLKDLYKDGPCRSVELHIETDGARGTSLLARAEMRSFHGIDMPVLSPADLFLGQGLHAFKHVCSEFSRVSHLIEFRRHVIARRHDPEFWSNVEKRTAENPPAATALGVLTLLITHVMGDFAPKEFTRWTISCVPPTLQLWVRTYAKPVIFVSVPGTKLYLLLQSELAAAGVGARRPLGRALLPLKLPPLIAHPKQDETARARIQRNVIQLSFILLRLRFHFVEGIRYLYESIRWRRRVLAWRTTERTARRQTAAQRIRHYGTVILAIAAVFCFQSIRAQQTTSDATAHGPELPGISSTNDQAVRDQPTDASMATGPLISGEDASEDTAKTAHFAEDGYEPLTANQIFSVIRQDPDALIELKSLMSDLAQQQGTPVQPDAISDEMLYSKIVSSSDLRANISIFLRARGYVSETTQESYSGLDTDGTGLPQQVMRTSGGQLISAAPAPFGVLPSAPWVPGSRAATSVGESGETSSGLVLRRSPAREVTSEPQELHEPAPYNLLSLRDLYTQLPEQDGKLKRFGSEIFIRRDVYSANQLVSAGRPTSLDVPPGPDYVVGPGDSLSINLWGSTSQNLTRSIDQDGMLNLPEAGEVQLAGLTLSRTQNVIAEALSKQYRNLQVAVTVAHLHSIRVYVVGDVQRPGAFEISSLATSLNALFAAGGPTSIGSLRVIRHYRGNHLIGEIDLYDFLLHGVQNEDRLQSGDTLAVPPAGPQVAIYGAIRRPAIYELKGEATLAEVIQDAGGVTVSAELGHIVVDRIDANRQRETVSLDLSAGTDAKTAHSAISAFAVHDGDHVHVAAILPYSQKVVYMQGHVVRPGRTPYREGMRLNDVLHSYQDLLPEPADRGEIVRLVPPDLHPETIEFNVPDALIGNDNIALQPFDTVRIFGRYQADPPRVTIAGEVLRPGSYALSRDMTTAQLVRMAGGFRRDALLTSADLTSYRVVGGAKVVSDRRSIRIGDAVNRNDQSDDAPLKPGDVLTVHQLTGWNDIGSSITLEGEVAHPGTYGFQQGERLSSILRRAGGFRETSYPAGAVLIRDEVRKLEEKSREQLIRQIETSSASARISPNLGAGDQSATLQLISQQQNDVLSRLRSQPAVGRLVIHISADISSWENTPADVEVRAGDVLRIPKHPGFVLVTGQVYNSSAITFIPNKTAGWYLSHAGGVTQIANKKEIFVIRANGSVVGREPGFWNGHDVLDVRLDPGDVVVVPQKIIGASLFWRNLLTVAQIASSIAVTAAVAGAI